MSCLCVCNIAQIYSKLTHVAVELLLRCNEIYLTVFHQEYPQAHWSQGQECGHVDEARNQAANNTFLLSDSLMEIGNLLQNTQLLKQKHSL